MRNQPRGSSPKKAPCCLYSGRISRRTGLEGFDFPAIGKGMTQLELRDASRSFHSRSGVAQTKQEQTRAGIEDVLEPAHVANAVDVGKNVKQAGVNHVIEAFGALMEL